MGLFSRNLNFINGRSSFCLFTGNFASHFFGVAGLTLGGVLGGISIELILILLSRGLVSPVLCDFSFILLNIKFNKTDQEYYP